MGRKRIYFTEEDLKKKTRKHYRKYKGYFRIYGRNHYLMKKLEELSKTEKDRVKKIDEMILVVGRTLKNSSKKPQENQPK